MRFRQRLLVMIIATSMLLSGSFVQVYAEEGASDNGSFDAAADSENVINGSDEAEKPSADDASANSESEESEIKPVTKQTIEAEVAGSDASVTLTGKMPEDAAVTAEAADAGVEGMQTVTAYDITIFADGADSKAEAWEPEAGIKVSIGDDSLAEIKDGTEVDVYHILDPDKYQDKSGEAEEAGDKAAAAMAEPEFVCKATVKNGEVTFTADSFSVYVIAQGPEPVEVNPELIQSLSELASACDPDSKSYESEGFYLSYTNSEGKTFYATDALNNKDAFILTDSIESAASWFLEPVAGANNRYLIRSASGSVYMHNKSGNLMELSASGTAFDLSDQTSARFFFKSAGANKWLQYSNGGTGFRLWTDANDPCNPYLSLTKVSSTHHSNDPYDLDGKTYGIMYYNSGEYGNGMLAQNKDGSKLASSQLLVRNDPHGQSRILYIAQDASIAKWTFQNKSEDMYYLASDDGKYLSMNGSTLSVVSERDDNCVFKVIPGTGSDEGKIRLIGPSDYSVVYNNNAFVARNTTQWLNLAEDSVYEDDDFTNYSAYKVSVSDRVNVANGKQVVIYTRFWNEEKRSYEFYVVDQTGDLIRAYESGDAIVWIGTQNNTLLWDFTEYYEPGTTTPNHYYDLQNAYNGKYLAPQVSGGQVFTDDPHGIQLNGRRDDDYFTTILSWDDSQYDYAGLKVETNPDGTKKLVSCPMAQAGTFYFAVMSPESGDYTEVETVDHKSLGLTMKMVDYNGTVVSGGSGTSPSTKQQTDVMGTRAYTEGNSQPGLLTTNLKDGNSYPEATLTGKSLRELFTGATEVNNLFIQSVYDGSGYYQFDSTENFAHLNGREFTVYQELGTVTKKTDTCQHGQFMPYNELNSSKTPGSVNPKNLTDIYAKKLSDNYPRKNETLYELSETEDYYFGMEIEGSFMQTPSGHDAWGHDIIFEFVGDDDFWLYVDGELVIDLGGIHKALGGSVNYSTGKVVVNGNNTTLYDIFRNNYAARNNLDADDPAVISYVNGIFRTKTVNGETCHVFKDYSSHDVRIFYMERGAGASNLRMRFNMATVTPGEVQLTKEITGTDKQDFASVRFPFQILYDNGDGAGERLLDNTPDPVTHKAPVTIKNYSEAAPYDAHTTIEGNDYNCVYYLKPGQTACIQFPDDTESYRIVECGVDKSMYDSTLVNDEEPDRTEIHQSGGKTVADYSSSADEVAARPRIKFSNHVNPSNLRTLTVTKKLFDENGDPISADADSTGFKVRLYLGDDLSNLSYYNMGDYFIRNERGEYCRFNPETGKFSSLLITDFDSLSDEQKAAATFKTSSSGAVDKLPAGYSVEVRDLLVGTSFKVIEEDYDIPVGYGKRSWTETEGGVTKSYECYKRVAGSYLEGDSENSGTIRDNSNPAIEVHNQKGFGIRANREWSDADFMRSHDDTYFAVFVDSNRDGSIEKSEILPGTVKKIDNYDYTTWFFPALVSGADFADYHVREISLANPGSGADGAITYDDFRIIDDDSNPDDPDHPAHHLFIGGVKKDGTSLSGLEYSASYKQGTTEGGSTYRTDTVTNTRMGGLRIVLTNMEGDGLSGAIFRLKKSDGTIVGNYTSADDGLVTTAYLEDGTYVLAETRMPRGYEELVEEISFTVNGSSYESFSPAGSIGYEYDSSGKVLTVKNRPFTLTVYKIAAGSDAANPEYLSGAHFELYKEMIPSGGGAPRKDYYPFSGYENLVTGTDGIVPDIDNTLPAGTYYLTETQAPAGYILSPSPSANDVKFTISNTGVEGQYCKCESDDPERTESVYTITIPNYKDINPAPTDVVMRYLPYILILIAGAALAAVVKAAKKRRNAEDEESDAE